MYWNSYVSRTLRARQRRRRSGCWRRSCRQKQRRRWIRMLSPLAAVHMGIDGGGGRGALVVPESSRPSSNGGNLVVPDSIRVISSSRCLVVPDSSSLRSASGSMVVPGSTSSGGSSTETQDNRCSAGVEKCTISSHPDSSSNMRRLVGLAPPDESGISRTLLRHQGRRWGECTSASGLVP